jgi:hypothetical protein
LAKSKRWYRKRRTREHVIAALSINHVERFILQCGYVCEETRHDYGYDLIVFTFDSDGFVEEGLIYLQVKATESLVEDGDSILLTADSRDCSIWIAEPFPVFLIIYEAATKQAYWLHVQDYFAQAAVGRPHPGAKSVRVRVPRMNVVGMEFPRHARMCKMISLNTPSLGED